MPFCMVMLVQIYQIQMFSVQQTQIQSVQKTNRLYLTYLHSTVSSVVSAVHLCLSIATAGTVDSTVSALNRVIAPVFCCRFIK